MRLKWTKCCLILFLVFGLSAFVGCSENSPAASTLSVDGSKYLLESEPENAANVIKVREEAKDEDDVVIDGRIGGRVNPWVNGQAAFLLVDSSLKSCVECGHKCPKPWDYC